MNELHK